MADLPEILALITELTSLLTVLQKLADLVRQREGNPTRFPFSTTATPTQC